MLDSTIRSGLRTARVAGCAGLAALLGADAQANWTALYASSTSYSASFSKVPDFDQRRSVLPNNGAMYCVPTAGINWAAYFAHHGFPGIAPGDEPYLHWQWSPAGYDTISNSLFSLGVLMGTDAFKGTGVAGAVGGLSSWLSSDVLVMRYSFTGGASPNFDKIAKWALQGVPVTASVGWYTGTEPVLTRNGGHQVSVVRVVRSGSQRLLGIHDPGGDSAGLTTQSPFARQDYACDERFVLVGGIPRLMDKVVGYNNGYIDAFTVMLPTHALSTSSDATRLQIKRPAQFTFDTLPPVREILAPDDAMISDVAISPYQPEAYFSTGQVVGGAGAHIFRYDFIEDEVRETLMEVASPGSMCTGRRGELYVADGATVRCFDPRLEEQIAALEMPGPIWTITYNDITEELVVLVGDQVVRLGEGLILTGPVRTLPEALTMLGARSMAASPVTGELFLTSRGSPGVYRFPGSAPSDSPLNEFTVIGAGALTEPLDLCVGDREKVYVSSAGVRKVFRRDPASGVWGQDTSDPHHNQPASRREKTAYSRTNVDPATLVGPAYDHVLPTQFSPSITVCLADINDDNSVNGADLGILLGAWGAANADLNGDGVTNGADLGILLGAWGACP